MVVGVNAAGSDSTDIQLVIEGNRMCLYTD